MFDAVAVADGLEVGGAGQPTASSTNAGTDPQGGAAFASSASANLPTGELKASAQVNAGQNGTLFGTSFAQARFSDRITVNESFTAALPVIVHGHVGGRFVVDGLCCGFNFSDSDLGAEFILDAALPSGTPLDGDSWRGEVFGTDVQNGVTAISQNVDLNFLLQPGEQSFDLFVELDALANNIVIGIGAADFGHTAQLGLTLPQGFTFSSASGQFLAPVPPAVILFGSALLSLAGWRRWRSCR